MILLLFASGACTNDSDEMKNAEKKTQFEMTAEDILGNPDYLAISFGGYRDTSRAIQPTVEELKEDMRILQAMGVKLLRTYNVHLPHAENVLKAIDELVKQDSSFEMYVMLGAWIDCEGAWTGNPNHDAEDVESNTTEINRVVELANQYPHIVKIIAVGNEAMVKWAQSYYVQPGIILKWVTHLQELKENDKLPANMWITSSDNFASWGGGSEEYHVEDLNKLIASVDYVSMHTYPMHDTHYNPAFWGVLFTEADLTKEEKINVAVERSMDYAKAQYEGVVSYMKSLDISKPIHIGETGWASYSIGLYGINGSKATDELKEGLYYKKMRAWTNSLSMSCFYFEAFDEHWKDPNNLLGSENHFGLIKLNGEVKYALWDLVDSGAFVGLQRGGNKLVKSYQGNLDTLINEVELPPLKEDLATVY